MSLFRNSVLNILGSILPALVAIPSLGYMARNLSVTLFGVTLLILALIGYAGVLDLGLGRAVVRHVSRSANNRSIQAAVIGTALVFVIASGGCASLIIYVLSENLASYMLSVGESDYLLSVRGLKWAAFCIPPLLVSVVLQSYFEGVEKFVVFNVYKTVSGVSNFLFPVVGLHFAGDFVGLMEGLFISRLASCFLVFLMVHWECSSLTWRFRGSVLKELVSFGGWLTITNIVSPLMVYMDRFLIAKLSGPQAVAFYSAPAELVSRMTILPVAVSRAVFPRLAAIDHQTESVQIKKRAYLYMFLLVAPVVFVFAVLASWIIRLWLGEDYVAQSGFIFRVMLIGLFFNSLALIPYTSLQAKGHSFITAMIHVYEVIPYLGLLLVFAAWKGIEGASIVWTLRMAVDFLVMRHFDSRKEMKGA